MALNFPGSPSDGQIYTDTATGSQYVYVGAYGYWSSYNSGGGYFQGNNGNVGPSNFGDIFRTHTNTLTGIVVIPSSNNSIAAGPLIIADGASLTIQSNARVAIV